MGANKPSAAKSVWAAVRRDALILNFRVNEIIIITILYVKTTAKDHFLDRLHLYNKHCQNIVDKESCLFLETFMRVIISLIIS